ncbi:ClpP/crotonase [Ceraceosorus guamensis]|uniref:ClpP/crotonase n=1 Tax=Ceraceosorus guamensis TaxID=1522189 RepID=A0A316W1J4_9BASI|nr:ClpP/crotonase [Ceraceosorus guamensis]PWN42998.1 ClpP/crotonase [Ceraceosorus guamensis]
MFSRSALRSLTGSSCSPTGIACQGSTKRLVDSSSHLRAYSTARPLAYLEKLSESPLSRSVAHHPSSGQSADPSELDRHISLLTLDRAPARNAIGVQMLGELEQCVNAVRHDGTRVLVVRSLVPSTFCAGADLRERKSMSPAEVNDFLLGLRRTFTALEKLEVPSISALDGTALGGGLELALATDVRVAGPGAKLGLTETRLGIIPGAGGTLRLTRQVGTSRAKDLIFSARILDGRTALEFGLVEHYAPAQDKEHEGDEALNLSVQLARSMAANGPLALRAAKAAIDRSLGIDNEAALDWERACYDRLMDSNDRQEGLRAFAEKRAPRYTGT